MSTKALRSAVVLAAGRGTRMGQITQDMPKPMLSVQGRPMLAHILDRLAKAGIERFFLVVGYRHHVIEEHFQNWPLPIEFRLQDPLNGTGSAALLARDFAGSEPFLLTWGDILCDHTEFVHCIRIFEQHPAAMAVVGVKAVEDPWQGAAVYEDNGRIYKIIEKPPQGTSTTRWNSAGFYAFSPPVFDYLARLPLSQRGEYELTSALDMMLQDQLELRISPVEGDWRDVGRPEDLSAVNQ